MLRLNKRKEKEEKNARAYSLLIAALRFTFCVSEGSKYDAILVPFSFYFFTVQKLKCYPHLCHE